MTLEEIDDIAGRYAKNVCEAGSPGADRHNRKTIAAAIQEAMIKHERDRQLQKEHRAANRRNAQARRKTVGPGNGAPAMPELPTASDTSSG